MRTSVLYAALVMLLLAIPLSSCSLLEKNPTAPTTASVMTPADTAASGIQNPGATPNNAVDRKGFAWAYGDWTSGILYEARFALSRAHNGISSVPVYVSSTNRTVKAYYGDWDYVNSDPFARDAAKKEAFYQWGYHIGPYNGHFSGGTCTWFVRLVLYRATYGAGYGVHLTTPNYPYSVYSWTDWGHMTRNWGQVRGGFVGSSPGNHMLIFDSRATFSGKIGWWVIDSNYLGGAGPEWIGKHFMSDEQLNSDNYWAWYPSWATTQ